VTAALDLEVLEKECSICGETLPLDALHFVRKSESADGFDTRCRPCERVRNHQKEARAKQLRMRRAEHTSVSAEGVRGGLLLSGYIP
jgi:hypothetical protein